MCAISGVIDITHQAVGPSKLKELSDRMVLRGPDTGGVFVEGNVGLAHRRLSIIDLSTGDQPMKIEDGNIVIVYNGEVYNFRKLRNKLISF